jgi:hypothetical protein
MELSDQLYSPAALSKGENATSFHWMEDWTVFRAGMNITVERTNSAQLGIEHRLSKL